LDETKAEVPILLPRRRSPPELPLAHQNWFARDNLG
jgi:hypothetical protein